MDQLSRIALFPTAFALVLTVAGCTSTSDEPALGTVVTTVPVDSTQAPSTTEPPALTTTAVPLTSSTASPPPQVSFPPEVERLDHGGEVWVVVLAGSSDFADPLLGEAVAAAESAGYDTGPTDCDMGASEALGLGAGQFYTVSVYLQSELDAGAAVEAFADRGVLAVPARVQTFCLD